MNGWVAANVGFAEMNKSYQAEKRQLTGPKGPDKSVGIGLGTFRSILSR